ncbi:MAG: hypothetical protein AAFQ05_00305 [Pseudomonadota bacterium]
MVDTPRKPFTLASDPDPAHLRDKDNAQPRVQPPQGVTKPAPNLAPPGMSGIKTSTLPRAPSPPNHQAGIALDAAELNDHEAIDGRVITLPGYSFQAKLSDTQSPQNINGERIKSLNLWKHNNLIATYNKGWQRDPPTPEAKEAVHRIRNGLDGERSKDFKPLHQSTDKDHGHDR